MEVPSTEACYIQRFGILLNQVNTAYNIVFSCITSDNAKSYPHRYCNQKITSPAQSIAGKITAARILNRNSAGNPGDICQHAILSKSTTSFMALKKRYQHAEHERARFILEFIIIRFLLHLFPFRPIKYRYQVNSYGKG